MRKIIAAGLIACFALLNQSCRKNEISGSETAENSRKLKVNDTFIGVTTVPTGSYKIVTNMTVNVTNKALGIDFTSYNPGALVKQLNYVQTNSKDWRITNLGNGYYSIINTLTGQGLTIGNTTEHSSVIQYPYGGPDNQQWKIEYQGAYGIYRIRAKQDLTKGLHVDPSSTAHGATIKIQTYGSAN
ncbi:MAG: RICIN domain-containing protein, partial [Mucilaginibacter sp.]